MLTLEIKHPFVDLPQPDCVGIPHGSSAVGWKPVSVEINDIDISGAQRITLFENAGAFVDHGVNAALDDLLVTDGPPRNAGPPGRLFDQGFDFRIGERLSIFIVAIPSRAGLLSQSAHLVEF